MQKVFSKKVAIVCIAIAVSFSLMSFSDSENQENYGVSSNSSVTTTMATTNEAPNFTAAALRLVVAASRVVVRASVEAAEFVLAHNTQLGLRASNDVIPVEKLKDIKFKNLD